MRRALLFLCVALVVAAPAQAKGPTAVTITGPGLERALVLEASTDSRAPFYVLRDRGGFFAQFFGTTQGEGTVLARGPGGDLGPRYVAVYRVPGPSGTSLIRQELYPFAAQPVSYMPKQRYWDARMTAGGWYAWGRGVKAALVRAGLPAAAPRQRRASCRVTTSTQPSNRYGGSRLWVFLPPGGVLRTRRNVPDDGTFGTKLGWIPDRHRGHELTVTGRRLDAPGRMRVLGVFWGRASTGKWSWASAVSFPAAGCWRITGRVGPTTVSYVVRVATAG